MLPVLGGGFDRGWLQSSFVRVQFMDISGFDGMFWGHTVGQRAYSLPPTAPLPVLGASMVLLNAARSTSSRVPA